MKIYTKTGDQGTTSLFGGTRVPKHHIRIHSYGTIDELNSWLGLIRDQPIDANTSEVLTLIQEKLFTVGAILATEPSRAVLKISYFQVGIQRCHTVTLHVPFVDEPNE